MFAANWVVLMKAVTSCALPGCNVLIEDIPGRPVRRYCSAAHRAAARQARRASAHDDQDARLADALPWLREHPGRAPTPDPQGGSGAVSDGSDDGSGPHRVEPPLRAEPPLRVEPPLRAGPPLRVEPPVQTIPPVQVEPPLLAASSRAAAVAVDVAPRAPETAPARRWRALTVLSAAVVLTGTYAVTVAEPVAPPETPVQAAPKGETQTAWAVRARLSLTSINRQLDTVAQTEEAWSRMPNQAAAPAAPVAALMERKVLLERRQAALRSQLGVYDSVREARQQLELSEQQLRAVESVLQGAPPEAQRSPAQAGEIALLIDQRDVHIRQREARRQELANLQNGVQAAARTSLPDDGHETDRITDEVLDVIRGDRDERRSDDPAAGPPEVIGGRQGQDGQPRQDVANSAPPDPRGPRDEPDQGQRERDQVRPVARTVAVLDDGRGDDAESAERGRAEGVEDGSAAQTRGGGSAVDSLQVGADAPAVSPTAGGRRAGPGTAAPAGGRTEGSVRSMMEPWSGALGSMAAGSSDWQRSSSDGPGSGSTDSDDDDRDTTWVSDMGMGSISDMGSISNLDSGRGSNGWSWNSGNSYSSGDSDESSDDDSDSSWGSGFGRSSGGSSDSDESSSDFADSD
ncbi:MAG: hypothetical protein ACRDRH_00880 [Pseudonocardia sp.]